MKIRQIEISELDNVAEGAREFFSDSESFTDEFNPETFNQFWKFAIETNQGVFFIMVNDTGKICGGIGGLAVPDYLTGVMVAQEMFWYTRKQHRGRGVALLDAYEKWATERGCKRLRMVHLSDLMPNRLKAFYEKKGYREIETTYEMEVV